MHLTTCTFPSNIHTQMKTVQKILEKQKAQNKSSLIFFLATNCYASKIIHHSLFHQIIVTRIRHLVRVFNGPQNLPSIVTLQLFIKHFEFLRIFHGEEEGNEGGGGGDCVKNASSSGLISQLSTSESFKIECHGRTQIYLPHLV